MKEFKLPYVSKPGELFKNEVSDGLAKTFQIYQFTDVTQELVFKKFPPGNLDAEIEKTKFLRSQFLLEAQRSSFGWDLSCVSLHLTINPDPLLYPLIYW